MGRTLGQAFSNQLASISTVRFLWLTRVRTVQVLTAPTLGNNGQVPRPACPAV